MTSHAPPATASVNQSTSHEPHGPRVHQSRGCHLFWYEPSVLALKRYFAVPRPRPAPTGSIFIRRSFARGRNRTRSGTFMSDTYMRIAPTRILLDVKSSREAHVALRLELIILVFHAELVSVRACPCCTHTHKQNSEDVNTNSHEAYRRHIHKYTHAHANTPTPTPIQHRGLRSLHRRITWGEKIATP